MDPIQPPLSLRERVENSLAAAIVSGEMAPGELFSAPVLAARFHVSATPVREAMLNLEKRGLVVAERNKGFRVTEMSEQELREIVAVRQMLEAPVMREVAAAFPHDRIDEFRAMADAIAHGVANRDLGAYLAADHEFHIALLRLVGNETLIRVVEDLRSRTRLTGLAQMLSNDELDESVREHHQILDRIVAGDGDAAYELTMVHLGHIAGWWSGLPEDSPQEEPVGAAAESS